MSEKHEMVTFRGRKVMIHKSVSVHGKVGNLSRSKRPLYQTHVYVTDRGCSDF